MAAQVYTFKITYENCDHRIWREAEVSSNYTLAELGYMVLATFKTLAYHLFEMEYKGVSYCLTEEDLDDLPLDLDGELLDEKKIGTLGMKIGDVIKMTYDLGCCQVFEIALIKIAEMQKGHGRAYPKIIDGAGKGIVDDMPAEVLLDAIKKTDSDGHSEIFYSEDGDLEWDYRRYDIISDNILLKGGIERIRDGYEDYDE